MVSERKEKAAVYIDGSNFYKYLKDKEVQFPKGKKFLSEIKNEGFVVKPGRVMYDRGSVESLAENVISLRLL